MARVRKDSLSEFLSTSQTSGGDPRRQQAAPEQLEDFEKLLGRDFKPDMAKILAEAAAMASKPAAADRIADWLRENGPAGAPAILNALSLGVEEGMQALERLEGFGLITRETGANGVFFKIAG